MKSIRNTMKHIWALVLALLCGCPSVLLMQETSDLRLDALKVSLSLNTLFNAMTVPVRVTAMVCWGKGIYAQFICK